MSYANEDERQSVLLASTAGIDVESVPRNLELDVKLDTDATQPHPPGKNRPPNGLGIP
jgi:hypothetical protein